MCTLLAPSQQLAPLDDQLPNNNVYTLLMNSILLLHGQGARYVGRSYTVQLSVDRSIHTHIIFFQTLLSELVRLFALLQLTTSPFLLFFKKNHTSPCLYKLGFRSRSLRSLLRALLLLRPRARGYIPLPSDPLAS